MQERNRRGNMVGIYHDLVSIIAHRACTSV